LGYSSIFIGGKLKMTTTEQGKLKIRIEHWIEHNTAHAEEFRELSEAIKTGINSDVSADLVKAAEEIRAANGWLEEAIKKIG
jgi:hypothetical protein